MEAGKLEAENCLSFIEGKEFELPIFYDLEDRITSNALNKKQITTIALDFCKTIKNAGFEVGVYANLSWFTNFIDVYSLIDEGIKIWLAQWSKAPTANFPISYWQYTSDGHVAGIDGRVDMNISYVEIPKSVNNVEKPVDNLSNNEEGEEMKTYKNGSTAEIVYSDSNCTNRIGCLNPYEVCECYGIWQNKAVVRYKVDGQNNYKVGFCKWLRWT